MADNIKISIDKGLLDDLDKYAKAIAKECAVSVRDELYFTMQSAMAYFYGSYTPIVYKRTGNMDNSYKKYYKNPHGNIYYGGVQIDPAFIDDVYALGKETVFDYVIFRGIHGYPDQKVRGVPIPRMLPTPIDRVLQRKADIQANLDTIVTFAKQYASSLSYQYLSFE